MASEHESWPEKSIGDLLREGVIQLHKDGNHGSGYPRASEFGSEGVPFLTAKLVDDGGRIDIAAAPRLPEARACQLRFGFVQSDDVLLSHNATVGRVAIVPKYSGQLLIGTSLTCFRLDNSRLLPQYLAAYFRGQSFQNQLSAVMGLSTRSQVPVTTQRSLSVVVPPMPAQRAIASVLGGLDDRIDLLRQSNATLEAIAQALFKSWFVDFDPVRAKAEGREPEGMDAETAVLFPSEFEDSELGLIPRRWECGTLASLAQQSKGVVNPLLSPDSEFSHYSLPAFDGGMMPTVERGAAIKSNKTPVPSGAVLISKLNPHIPRVWFVGDAAPAAVCSTEFLVWKPRPPFGSAYLYCLASSSEFNSSMRQLVTGTSNSHQRVKPDHLASLNNVVPPASVAAAFEQLAKPLLLRFIANRELAASLAMTRDALLPRLISGKLRLPEAQPIVEESLT